jgi:peptide/nickel transport system substrate-binding protein
MARSWTALGIDAGVKVLAGNVYDDHLLKGTFDVLNAFGGGGSSVYQHYWRLTAGYVPIGTDAYTNYERWKGPAWAAMQRLFARYQVTLDPHRQHALADGMQHLWVDNLPAIPTTLADIPEEFSTRYYTGFPTASHNYAFPMPFTLPQDTIMILTRITPTH